ncbi:MAG: hypothetical protein IT372_25585 [Polyangiaceae bacterium]|nr:hypothetical protein [Polyangiaceae bacterium]
MRSGRPRRTASCLALLAALSSSGAARAGDPSPPPPTAQDKALAEALFQDGRKLMEGGRIAEACAKLAESQRLDPSAGALLNLGVCHDKLGKTASAWAELKQAASMSAAAGKKDRAELALRKAAEVEARLARLVLEIPSAAPGLVIQLNDNQLSAAAAGGSGVPIDPGEYTVQAIAPGKKTWSERITVEPGPSTKTLTIPALEDAEGAPPPEPAPKPEPRPEPKPEGSASGLRTLGFIAGGVGLAGLAAGGVFGALTFSKAGEASKACGAGDTACGDERRQAYDDGQTTALISNIAFGAGAALLAGGVVLILTSGPAEEPEARQGVWISPEAGPAGGGMRLGGRW